jgi:feruloyl esterase
LRSLPLPALLVATLAANAPAVHAQAFADVAAALVDYSRAEVSPGKSCEALAGYEAEDIVAIRSAEIPARDAVPEHCRITGTLAPEIAFEVSLPARWNGRFYMIGNGGLAGESLEDPLRTSQRDRALQLGFAFAQTNTGHDARKEPGGTFVLSNPQKAMDYAYWAVHVTATTAKTLTAQYYARPITHSYWNSCSNGGRQGLIEAQRYPQDFDGLVVNAPWVDQTGYTLGSLWNQRAVSDAHLTPAKLELLATHVMKKCDAIDGLEDGLIDDPRKCSFDARRDVPSCAAGADTDACLTPAQAHAVMQVYSGPQSHGRTLFPGYMPGSEAVVHGGVGNAPAASAWMNFIVAAQPGRAPADFNLAENTMRYLVLTPPQPDYDYHTFDFDRDTHLLERWGKQVNATDTNLKKLRTRGGKLLMTYGWADQVLQPLMGVNYYERAVARNGPGTRDFFRLFMVPGMNHCSGGTGTDQFDSMTAMIDWVEKGKAPDVLQAARVLDEKVVRTRPLCPYPQVARYQGHGSIDAAESFRCVAP